MARAFAAFAPLGWAPCGAAPADVYSQALATLASTGSTDEAEKVLVAGWNAGERLEFGLLRLKSLGAGDADMQQVAGDRWMLARKALRHHQARAYEASVPVVLSVIDGITLDLTGKQFFDHKNGRLRDQDTVLGMDEALAAMHGLFASSVKRSGATGSLSRHGILHGRELGYDTLLNSTKCLVLLLAVIEWARPRAVREAERRLAVRERRWAGSDALDEHGRRRDRRGFHEAQQALHRLEGRQLAEYRRNGRYGTDLGAMFPGDLGDRYLRGSDHIILHVYADGQRWWAACATPSGFVLGIAGADGDPLVWYYADEEPPVAGPGHDPRWSHVTDSELSPEW